MAPRLTAQQLTEGLDGFYGTQQYHRLSIWPGLVGTDGVAYLCREAGAFWLFDLIAAAQPRVQRDPMLARIQFWTLTVRPDRTATLRCDRDAGDPAFERTIERTDFPLPEARIWVKPGGPGGAFVAMLPSEN